MKLRITVGESFRRVAAAGVFGCFVCASPTAGHGQAANQGAAAPPKRDLAITYVGSTEGWAPVPFERFRNEIFFKATINGQEAAVMLDNGVDATVIDSNFAMRARMKLGGSAPPMRTGTATIPGQWVDGGKMEIPHHLLLSGRLIARDLKPLASIMGHPVDAILGGDVLNTMAVGVITSNRSIYLLPSGDVTPKAKAAVIPLISGSQIDAEINGKPVRLYIDLGSNGAVNLSDDAWRRVIPADAIVTREQHSGGEGVVRNVLQARNNLVRLGGITARSVQISNIGRVPRGADGLLGGTYFSYFDIVLDVGAKTLTLIPLNKSVDLYSYHSESKPVTQSQR